MATWDPDASNKAIVYFKDGNCRTFYAREFPYRSKKRNVELGLKRLREMILVKFRHTHETAFICCTISGEKKEKYVRGEKKDIDVIEYKNGHIIYNN